MPSQRTATQYGVYLSEIGETVNGEGDIVTYLVPLSVSLGTSSRGMMRAEFAYDIAQTGEHLRNLKTPTEWKREVEIWARNEGELIPLFWGDLTTQDLRIADDESVAVSASLEPYHFGAICEGIPMWDGLNEVVRIPNDDVYFNPVIDGEVVFNKSNIRDDGDNFYLWHDPESIRTQAAKDEFGFEPAEWTIPDALESICWHLNPDEQFVKNFDKLAPEHSGLFTGAPPIRDVVVNRGKYLPDYLDAILLPLGFDWYIEMQGQPGSMERRIKVFKRGDGDQTTLKLQDIGEGADYDENDLFEFRMRNDVKGAINRVVLHGAVEEKEITVELYRAWDSAQDTKEPADVDRSDPDSEYLTYPLVLRKWVANEAGDYTGTRTGIDNALDLSEVFSEYVPRRRRFRGLMSVDIYNDPLPPLIEYDPGDAIWRIVPDEWQATIMTTEMGVMFTGNRPPGFHDITKLRVTGTVTGDARIRVVRSDDSPVSGREQTLYVDVSDRFFYRDIQELGDYASVIPATDLYNESLNGERDDREAMGQFADDLLAASNSQDAALSAIVDGVPFGRKFGDIITQVEGRNIDLNMNSAESTEQSYPQIVGFVFRLQQERTDVLLRMEANV